jgi:translocation and assembly module TamB
LIWARIHRYAAVVLCCALVQAPAIAQESEEEARERSTLTALIEDNLSGADREVRIDGFRGALSSSASFERLTISDAQGVWLTLTEGQLIWTRSALLRGRLEVDSLSVARIELPRMPVGGDELPSATAKPFSLPELPVSISIGELRADEVVLGAPLFGRAAEVRLLGAAQLANGEGSAELSIIRIDGEEGALSLEGSYDNVSEVLDLDLELSEGADGILANLIGLPGKPSLALTAKGTAPLSDYRAQITLETEGQERLSGEISLANVVEDPSTALPQAPDPKATTPQEELPLTKRFSLDISGDITPLFDPEYRSFFGPNVSLIANGERAPDGAIDIHALQLSAKALNISGALSLSPESIPRSFSLAVLMKAENGAPVLLPLSGTKAYVRSAQIGADYSAENGEEWQLDAALKGYARGAVLLDTGIVRATGSIGRALASDATTLLNAVSAQVGFDVLGFDHSDPKYQRAFGHDASGDISMLWRQGDPLEISALKFSSGDLSLEATAQIDGLDSGYETHGTANVTAGSLARFAPLLGQPGLRGAAEFALIGVGAPLGGQFDLQLSGTGNNLGIGIGPLDKIIAGRAKFAIDAERNEAGTTLRAAALETPAVEAFLDGAISAEAASIEFDATLDNLGRIAEGINGPASAKGNANRITDTSWQIALDATGPGGANGRVGGLVTMANGILLDLTAAGQAPLGLANNFLTDVSVQGNARYDLALKGSPALENLSGNIASQGARVSLPEYGTTFSDLNLFAQLGNARAQITASTSVTSGGRIQASGPIGLTAPYESDLSVNLQNVVIVDPDLYSTSLTGKLSLAGGLASGAQINGEISLGATEIKVPSSGISGAGSAPTVIHKGAPGAVLATNKRAGLDPASNAGKAGPSSSFGLNILLLAPNRVFIRGRGLDAELGGRLRITGTSDNIIPVGQFSLVRGRLNILGKRLDLKEGSLLARGSGIPTIRLVAETETEDAVVQIIVEGPADDIQVSFSSVPELPEDEVLARLLFGRALTQISPLQAAQMANAVATLAGTGGEGLIGRLRREFGLDDLDLTTTDEGKAAVRVGKYITEKVYTDVTIDRDGKSEINLNFDINDAFTAKGLLKSTGETGVGIYFEKDY